MAVPDVEAQRNVHALDTVIGGETDRPARTGQAGRHRSWGTPQIASPPSGFAIDGEPTSRP